MAALKEFSELSEREILALAISNEEEDSRIYSDFAEALTAEFPASAKLFERMSATEDDHRRRLIALFKEKFGEHIPLIRRQDVKGFVQHKPVWLLRPLGIETVRGQAAMMELETRRLYEKAMAKTTDASIRDLLGTLAHEEREHEKAVEATSKELITTDVEKEEAEAQRRLFVLQVVQPGLAGLMDGSVSTLAPLFAAAFATQRSWDAFLVGIAASVGAGISMGFAEALSDDGSLTGRGRPWMRGLICGVMTCIGGIGHAIPYLLPSFWVATGIATVVVCLELIAISWIRHKYMDASWAVALFQVVLGGALVFLAGIVIGSS